MIEPFVLRALSAGIILAVIAAPLGCIVVWNRMAYFGETIAQAGLIGVALGLALQMDLTLAVLIAGVAMALAILLVSRQNVVPLDSVLGLMHHAALSAGAIAAIGLAGPSVDLVGYLFGDIFAVTYWEVLCMGVGGVVILAALGLMWPSLLRLAVNEELAVAEGVNAQYVRPAFIILLAIAIAFAIKIVGILLVVAFLVVPAVAARPFTATPEQMVGFSAVIAITGVVTGLALSWSADVPGGPAIVLVMAGFAATSLLFAGLRHGGS